MQDYYSEDDPEFISLANAARLVNSIWISTKCDAVNNDASFDLSNTKERETYRAFLIEQWQQAIDERLKGIIDYDSEHVALRRGKIDAFTQAIEDFDVACKMAQEGTFDWVHFNGFLSEDVFV